MIDNISLPRDSNKNRTGQAANQKSYCKMNLLIGLVLALLIAIVFTAGLITGISVSNESSDNDSEV